MSAVDDIVLNLESAFGLQLRKELPLPENLGDTVDIYHDVRDVRLLVQHVAEAIEAREKELREHLVVSIPKSNLGGVAGQKYRATIKNKEVTRIAEEGWGALTSWIREHNRFDLLQHRLSDKAVAEYREAAKTEIPGTQTGWIVDVSLEQV